LGDRSDRILNRQHNTKRDIAAAATTALRELAATIPECHQTAKQELSCHLLASSKARPKIAFGTINMPNITATMPDVSAVQRGTKLKLRQNCGRR
jgi:hypothetical protein